MAKKFIKLPNGMTIDIFLIGLFKLINSGVVILGNKEQVLSIVRIEDEEKRKLFYDILDKVIRNQGRFKQPDWSFLEDSIEDEDTAGSVNGGNAETTKKGSKGMPVKTENITASIG